jgi:hypothetical protein
MKIPRSLQAKAEAALKEAVKEVVEEHKRAGRPLAVWRNGKVAMISASKILRKAKRAG